MIYLWFANISLLFSEKSVSQDNKTTWKDGNMWGLLSWYWSLFYIFVFFLLFMLLGFSFIIPTVVGLVSTFCYFFPFFLKAQYKNKPEKQYTFADTLKNVVKFKLNIIMIIVSFLVILNASTYLGGGYSAFLVLVVCAISFFFFSIYKPYVPKASDYSSMGLGDFEQAIKECAVSGVKNEPGLMDQLGKVF